MNGERASSRNVPDGVAYCHCEEGWTGLRCDQGAQASTCENNIQDGDESDVDCGGVVCDAVLVCCGACVAGTKVGDAGATALAINTTITTLSLRSTCMSVCVR